jgi:ADP-heptose:LPS heptosyltransferase
MHLAAALKKPIVSIWGNTIPEFGMYPYFGQPEMTHPLSAMMEVKGLSCRPCSKLGFSKCPKGHFKCMIDIPEAAVAGAVDRFWRAA